MNRLGDILKDLIASIRKEKSVPTTRKESTEMMRDTFCPDCESLLFIRQRVDPSTSGSYLIKKC